MRDLWVLLESELTFARHIDQVCHSCYYQLRHLKVIARSLNFNAVVSVIHAFVFSRLNYCGSIFAGLPRVLMEKLRWVHRATAQLAGKFTRLTTNSSIVIVYVSIYLIYVVGIALASTPTTHLVQDRVFGVALLIWLGALLSELALLSCAGAVHCGPLSTAIWWSHSPTL